MQALPKQLLPFIKHFVRPYYKTFVLMFVVVFCCALHNSISQYFIKEIIDTVERYADASSSLYVAVASPAIMFVVLAQLTDSFWRFYDYLLMKIMPKLKADVTLAMFSHLEHHSYSYFQKHFSGSLVNKINDMSRGVETIIQLIIEPLFFQMAQLVVGVISMYMVHPWFAIIMVVWAIVFMGVVLALSRNAHHYSTVFSESRTMCMGKIVDSVTNILNIKLFARTQFEHKFLQAHLNDTTKKDQKLQAYMLKMKTLQGISVTMLLAAVLSLLLYCRTHALVSIGDFTFILGLSISIMQGLWYLAHHFVMFSQEIGMCSQALTLLSHPHSITDLPDAKKLQVSKGEIKFDQVHFNYHVNKPLFNDFSIHIPGGQKVGLVGFSGSGKTSFVNLILRFYELDAGTINIDGQNIATVTQDSLRSKIAMIPQDPLLFHRSLMENIRYGRLDASDEEVINASKLAHCHEFIIKQEQGYNMAVGERGIKISGGQRQRIAIARAIVKNAPIFILDEATSALDSATEQKIHEGIEYLMQNRTSIVIAHRLSTLTNMDRILVFHQGAIIEDGNHQTLLKQNGHYAKLWALQAGGFLPEKAEE